MAKKTLTNLPPAHHTVNSFIVVKGAADFISFVEYVFDGKENAQVRTPDRDGTLIHAEVVIGDSVIMVADRKPDWVFTPALTQVYVTDADQVLKRAVEKGGRIVTPISKFYGGYDIARFLDKWNNLWWLFTPAAPDKAEWKATTEWHSAKPSQIYTTLMETMRNLKDTDA